MIHKFGRGVVHAVAAWAAATMVMVIGAVVIQFVRAMSIFHTWDAVQRQGWFLWSAFDVYLAGFRAAVFLIVSLPIVAPVVMLFKRTDAGRARPLAARLVTVATSAVVGLFWQLMLPPYNRLSVQLCLSLAAGGTVIARAWFPLSAGASTSPAPLACE